MTKNKQDLGLIREMGTIGKMKKWGIPMGASLFAMYSVGAMPLGVNAEEVREIPEGETNNQEEGITYKLATDGDFKGTRDGGFRYVGDAEYVEIPSTIKGIDVTSYEGMFTGTSVKGVKSDNKNVTDVSRMFYSTSSVTLDVSGLDTSNVTNMGSMFSYANAKTIQFVSEDEETLFTTENVTNMKYMFSGTQAKTLDVSDLDTSSVVNMSSMFYNSKATSIVFGENFNTSNVTNMERMFMYSEVKDLDLTVFDTTKVDKMGQMFQESRVETVDLSNFYTENVQDMSMMFKMTRIKDINISHFDTSKVTSMYQMFYGSQADTIDVSNLDNNNVLDMREMFKDTSSGTINLDNFGTESVTNMREMFNKSSSKELNLTSFNTENVEDMTLMFNRTDATSITFGEGFNTESVISMRNMFSNARAKELDLTSFDTQNVTDMSRMLYNTSAQTINITGWDTTSVEDMGLMFYNSETTAITGLGGINTENVRDMKQMFSHSNVKELDLSNFYTSKVEDMRGMFTDVGVRMLDLSTFDTGNVKDMSEMFKDTNKLKEIKGLDTFNTEKVEDMSYMFSSTSAPVLEVSNFNTSKVENMKDMFRGTRVETLDLSKWDASKVTDMSYMFDSSHIGELNLKGINTQSVTTMEGMFSEVEVESGEIDVTSIDTSNVTTMRLMFRGSSIENIIGLRDWDTGNVTTMVSMFSSSDFKDIDISGWDTKNVTNMNSMFAYTESETVNVSGLSNDKVESMARMFASGYIAEIVGLDTFQTPSVKDMSYMFNRSSAKEIDISNFDTSKVENMGSMFNYTTSEVIDVSNSTNDKVTNMNQMFYGSETPTILGFDTFHTPEVTNMRRMFYRSYAKELDLTNFDTSNVQDMYQMFYESKADVIDVSGWENGYVGDMSQLFYMAKASKINTEGFKAPKATNMKEMFRGVEVEKLDLRSLETKNVTTMEEMFYSTKAGTVDLRGLPNDKLTNMKYMFAWAGIEDLRLEGFKTPNVTDMSWMFFYSPTTSVDLSSFDTSSVTNMRYMFRDSQATSLDLSNFDTSSVTTMNSMFASSKATSLDLSNFDISNVTDVNFMFEYSSAEELDLSSFKTTKATVLSRMFSGSLAKEINISNLDTSKVTNMNMMFWRSQVTELDLSNFDTSSVTSMSSMFRESGVKELDLTNFDTSNVTNMHGMFEDSAIESLDISSFDMAKVTSVSDMFNGAIMGDVYTRTVADATKMNNSSRARSSTRAYAIKPEVRYISPDKEGEPMTLEVKGTSYHGMESISSQEGLTLQDNIEQDANSLIHRYDVIDLQNYKFTMTDKNGNEIEHTVNIDKLDKVAPTIEFTQSNYEWTNEEVIVTAKGIDDFSGVVKMEGTTSISGSFLVGGVTRGDTYTARFEENRSILIRATDAAGNQSTARYYVNNIDRTKPKVWAEADTENWKDGDIDITFKATDNESGLDYIITPDGEKLYQDSYTYTTTEEGYHTLQAVDVVGNIKEKIVYLEKGKPMYVMADDGDFEWVTSAREPNHYRYIGVDDYVEIPKLIHGKERTSYQKMFESKQVKGVRSTSEVVTDMNRMFYRAYSETETIDVSGLNTTNVRNMSEMFMYTSAKNIVGLENFNTSNVTNMRVMFAYARGLESVKGVETFDTSNVTNMNGMFSSVGANEIDVSGFDTSKVTDMGSMFHGIQETRLDLSNFDTSNVRNMAGMFSETNVLHLDLSNFDTSNVTDMNHMFRGIKSESIDLSSFDTSSVTNMDSMFYNSQVPRLDLSSFDTSSVTEMNSMFRGANIDRLDLGEFDTGNVTTMERMFESSTVKKVDLSNLNTNRVENMERMFVSSQIEEQDFTGWDTSNVNNMKSMFMGTYLKDIDISSWDTNKVTDMSEMFKNSKSNSINVKGLSNEALTMAMDMFYGTKAKDIQVQGFRMDSVRNIREIFGRLNVEELDLRGVTLQDGVYTFNSQLFSKSNIGRLIISDMDLESLGLARSFTEYRTDNLPTILVKDDTNVEFVKNQVSGGGYVDVTVVEMGIRVSKEEPTKVTIEAGSGHGISSIETSPEMDVTILREEETRTVYELNLPWIGEYTIKATDNLGYTHIRKVYLNEHGNVYVLANDSDFIEYTSGNFKYVGEHEYVWIPETILGKTVTSYNRMFENTEVKGVKSDNPNVTDNGFMFRSHRGETLDIRELNTSGVQNMSYMFSESDIETIYGIEDLDTSSVTDMSNMFYGSKVGTIDLSSFDTTNVVNMTRMFENTEVATIDLSSFDTTNVVGMSYMFNNTEATTIDVSSFNTSNVENMSYMFANSKVRDIDLSHFDVNNVVYMNNMFSDSWATTIRVRGWSFDNIWSLSSLFRNTRAEVIDLRGWDTTNLRDLGSMFTNAKAKEILGLEDFETGHVSRMYETFKGAEAELLNLSKFEFQENVYLYNMFADSTTPLVYVRDNETVSKLENNTGINKPETMEYVVITAELWESEEIGTTNRRLINVEGISGHGIAKIESLNGLFPLEPVTKGDMSYLQSYIITRGGVYDFLVTDNYGNEEVVSYEAINIPVVETETEPIMYTVEERETDELFVGETRVVQEGQMGIETITYEVLYEDDEEVSRVEVGREVTTEPIAEIIEIGTKEYINETVYETEPIEFTVEYVDNPTLLEGETNVLQEGVNGERTYEYLEVYADEELISRELVGSSVTTEPVTQIIERGTLVREVIEETETEAIEYETITQENPDVPVGETKVLQEGVNGGLEITYEVTYDNGEEVSRIEVGRTVTQEATPEIIEIGTMVIEEVQETVVEDIDFETVYQNSSDLKVGEEKVVQVGVVGEETITYDVTYKNGEEISRTEVGRYVSRPAINEIILVGTKEITTETDTEVVEYETIIRENPELPVGHEETLQEGVNGERTITYEVTYVEGVEVGRVEVSSEVTTPRVNKIIEVGTYVAPEITTETLTTTEDVEYETIIKENPDLPTGQTRVIQEGVNGELTIETLVTYHDGVEVSREEVSRGVTTDPVNHIIEVGTQTIVVDTEERSAVVPYETITKENPELAKGETRVVQEGIVGERIDLYELTYINGELAKEEVIESMDKTPATPEIIEVGTLEVTVEEEIETESIAYETIWVETDDLLLGETAISQVGVNGTRTLTYEVTYHNGKEESRTLVTSEISEEATPEIILVGTLEVTTDTEVATEEIAYSTVTRDNPNLPKGETRVVQEGVNGVKETTYLITYHNGKEVNREVQGVNTTDETPRIVEIGTLEVTTGTVNETETIEYKEQIVENPNLLEGVTRVIREGVNGIQTNYYTVTYHNGVEVSREFSHTEVTSQAVDKIIEVGTLVRETKTGTEIQNVEYETEIVENPELAKGETRVVQEGKDGQINITYKVTYENGVEVGRVEIGRETVTPKVNEVIEVGTLEVTESTDVIEFTRDVDYKVITIENPDLEEGKTNIVQQGKVGVETIWRTYKTTFHNEEQVEVELIDERTEVTTEPRVHIIEIGTKVPVEEDPVEEVPTEEDPVEEEPTEEDPVEEEPTEEDPVEEEPTEEDPVEEEPVEEEPTEEDPVEEEPTEEDPVEEEPVEEEPTEEELEDTTKDSERPNDNDELVATGKERFQQTGATIVWESILSGLGLGALGALFYKKSKKEDEEDGEEEVKE